MLRLARLKALQAANALGWRPGFCVWKEVSRLGKEDRIRYKKNISKMAWNLFFIPKDSEAHYITLYYYTILYYTILYYTILYYTILYYTILYYAILSYPILSYPILYYTMLCYAMLCYAMLCYAMLCYAMLCYAMLCYAMLCCTFNLLAPDTATGLSHLGGALRLDPKPPRRIPRLPAAGRLGTM